jgi:hypothetical protein
VKSNLNALIEFRYGIYQSFKQARDALFNLVDALASEDRAQSLPELSLSPFLSASGRVPMKRWKTGSLTLGHCKGRSSCICRNAVLFH